MPEGKHEMAVVAPKVTLVVNVVVLIELVVNVTVVDFVLIM